MAFALATSATVARAQFLRLGPFDFTANTYLDGIYSSNVDNERASVSTAAREDYYMILGIDLLSTSEMSPNTTLKIDTGLSIERHLRRPDLNDSKNPFGRLKLDANTTFGYILLDAHGSIEHTSESADDVFSPGRSSKTRDPRYEYKAGGGMRWARRTLSLDFTADYKVERHDKEEFKEGDKDETTLFAEAKWQPWQYAGFFVSEEYKKTVFPHKPGGEQDDWQTTEKFGLDGSIPLNIIRRPQISYEFGLESKHGKDDDENKKWAPMHTITVRDEWDLSSTLHLAADAQWANKVVEDDVGITYGAKLSHEITRTARETFSATREPVETFGSTKNTDRTTFQYGFTKDDLFVYNLKLQTTLTYEINKPLDQEGTETENKWDWDFSLTHSRPLSRRLTRSLEYKYSWEKTNLETEILDEHRVTLKYTYAL